MGQNQFNRLQMTQFECPRVTNPLVTSTFGVTFTIYLFYRRCDRVTASTRIIRLRAMTNRQWNAQGRLKFISFLNVIFYHNFFMFIVLYLSFKNPKERKECFSFTKPFIIEPNLTSVSKTFCGHSLQPYMNQRFRENEPNLSSLIFSNLMLNLEWHRVDFFRLVQLSTPFEIRIDS